MRYAFVAVAAMSLLTGAADVPLQSPTLVPELTELLKQHNFETFGTRDPDTPGRFAAVSFFQHAQLLVVAGQYPMPSQIEPSLEHRQYADAYQALTVGCLPEGKVFFHDLQADGLHAGAGSSVDIMYERGVDQTIFDGNWSQHKITEKDYVERLIRADRAYSSVLAMLIKALKSMPPQP